MASFEFPDPETLAYQLSEAVADERGDENAQAYLAAFVDELFVLEPGLAERVTGRVLEELCEEVARCEDPKHSHATITLIKAIEEKWRNDA